MRYLMSLWVRDKKSTKTILKSELLKHFIRIRITYYLLLICWQHRVHNTIL